MVTQIHHQLPKFACLHDYPKLKKPPCVNLKVVNKKMKVVKPTPPLSPTSLRAAMLKVRFADTILKAQEKMLRQSTSDPVKLQEDLEKLKRKKLEEKEIAEAQLSKEKERVDAQLREEEMKRVEEKERVEAKLREKRRRRLQEKERVEAKLREEKERVEAQLREEKERVEAQLREEQSRRERQLEEKERVEAKIRAAKRRRDRRRERYERDKMEALAQREKPYCCTLQQLGILTQCDHAWSWGCWGSQHMSPLEQLGLHLKEEGDLREVELEEGEIMEELEEGKRYYTH